MSFFGDIGNFFGSLFDGGQQDPNKKKQQQQAPRPQVSSQQLLNPQPNTSLTNTVQAPKPFTPQQPTLSQPAPQISGVTIHPPIDQPAPQISGVTIHPPIDQSTLPAFARTPVNSPFAPNAHAAPQETLGGAINDVGALAAGANQKLLGGLIKEPVQLANYIGSGFNNDEATKRTNDFLRTTGQTNSDGNFASTNGYDTNGNAFTIGSNIGNVEKAGVDTAAMVLPGVGAEAAAAKALEASKVLQQGDLATDLFKILAPVVGGGAVSSGVAQAQNPEQDLGRNVWENILLSLAGPVFGSAFRGIKGLRGGAKLADEGIDAERQATKEISGTSESAVNENKPTPSVSDEPVTSSNTPTAKPTPTVTSANPDYVPPVTVKTPAPFRPPVTGDTGVPPSVGGVAPLRVAPQPSVDVPSIPVKTAEAQAVKAQAAVDKAATTPPPEVAPAKSAPTESPAQAKEQALAEAQTPPPQATRDELSATTAPKPDILGDAGKQIDDLFGKSDFAQEAPSVKQAPTAPKTEPVAQVPDYSPPYGKNGRAGVSGYSKVHYNTGDNNLDGLVNDSIIANKGTANTAQGRADALDKAGVDSVKRARIRNIAVKETNKETGRISDHGIEQIKKVLSENTKTPDVKAPAPKTSNKPPAPSVKQAPSTSNADQEVDAIMKQSADTLESGSYGKLVAKQARNSESASSAREPLTPAEKAIVDRLKPQLDAIRKDLNARGLTDDDMSHIAYRGDYLPTTKKDGLTAVNTVDDVANKDFKAANGRADKGNGLTDAQREEGAEQALRDYLRTGELVKNLSPEQVKAIKMDRRTAETSQLFEKDSQGGDTGIRLNDSEVTNSRAQTEKVVDAETAKLNAEKRVADGDTSGEALANKDATAGEARDASIEKKADDYLLLEKKTDERIKEIRGDDNINPDIKKKLITQLESHLRDVANGTYYLQSTVRTNLLLGTSRIADQVNKGAQATSDFVTNPLAKLGANKSFSKSAGRSMTADRTTSGAVYDLVKNNPLLNKPGIARQMNTLITNKRNEGKGIIANMFGKYNRLGTSATEAGSRFRVTDKNTVSYFTAKAQSEGITDVNKIADYVNSNIGTKEWDSIHRKFFDANNSFTGLPTHGGVPDKNIQLNVRTAIYNKLGGVPNLSRSMRENIADGVTIPLIGFPKLVGRLGVKGLDVTTLGARDLFKASRINPKNDAEALQKALYVQSAIRSAQSGTALGALGLYLGKTNQITGAYPSVSDTNERARWAKDKIQPYSLKVGDQYVDLGRYLGPLAFPIMIGATMASGKPQNIPATVGALTQQMLHNYGADSIGNVMSDVGDVLKGDKTPVDLANQYGAGIVAAFVPGSSLLNTAGKSQDMIQGNAQPDTSGGIVDKLRAKFPVTRDGLPGKKDTLGDPITQGNAFDLLPGVSGGQNTKARGEAQNDPVETEINRFSKAGYEVMPSKQNTNASQDSKNLARMFMETDTYKSADTKTQGDMFKQILAGTVGKDISNKISAKSQGALLNAKLLGSDKTKVWREDNDNNLNYVQATIDNKTANKTLNTDDQNMKKTGSLAQQLAIAHVNSDNNITQDVIQNYGDKGLKAMYNKMVKDGDPMADKLRGYDEALVAAGLPSKLQNSKGGYGSVARGGGRGGSGGSKSFAFANLPASLSGTGSTSSSGNGYASAAPLFKPIASLQAPPTVAIPKGRKISITKGVKV